MEKINIIYPVFVLVFWTFLVLSIIPFVRFRSAFKGEIKASDLKFGESPSVPPHVALPNRNLMNLLEMPVLFYLSSILVYSSLEITTYILFLSWSYVILRIVHSCIHLSYNNVFHRFFVFAFSNIVLIVLWILILLDFIK